MINVNQITAQLARMPDQTLQRYAQMHKADPYILSLALAESNRRKQMRAGAQMSVPEQPKVADQAVAGMGSGVSALPAQNMQGMEQAMAAGGIVAFDEGGEVERYNGAAGSLIGFGATPEQMALDELRRQAILRKEAARRAEEARYNALVEGREPPAAPAAAPNTPTTPPAAAPGAAAPAANAGPGTSGPRRNTGTPPPTAPAPAAARDDVIENLRKRVEPPKIDFTPSTAKPLDEEGLMALQRKFEVDPNKVIDPFLERRQAVAAAQEAAATEALEARKKQIAEMGVLGAERETRLKAREEKLGKQEKDLGPLAMLQAGFAMMSGASPFALQNMGVGAQAGLKTYNEGLDKLAAAKDRLDDAFGQLEIARRSERMMTDRELSGLEASRRQALVDSQKMFLQGAQDAYGVQKQDARTMFSAVVQGKQREADQAAEDRRKLAEMQSAGAREAMQQTGAGERTAAQLTVQERVAKMETAAKQADAAARLAELRSQVGAKNEAALVAEYAKNPMKLKILEQTDPALAAFIRQRIQAMTVPAVQNTPGTGGVRD